MRSKPHDFEAADVVWKTVKNGEQRLHLRAAAHADVEHTRLLSSRMASNRTPTASE